MSTHDHDALARRVARALVDAGILTTPERDARVAAKALREAAEALDDMQTPDNDELLRVRRDPAMWLYERAVRAEIEAGESDAHALSDEALVNELVRRGVLTEDDGGECDLDTRIHSVNCSCFGGSSRQRRYVTAWEADNE